MLLLLLFVIIFLVGLTIYLRSYTSDIINININSKSADITKPKFSINSDKQKISVTADNANFITNDEIMLEKNVIFKSKKFKIFGEKVIFDKQTLIASSKEKSKFISKNTSIESIGFDITENGNILNFKGKTKLTLK